MKKKYINLSILIFLICIIVFIYTNSKLDISQIKGYILTGDENDVEKAVVIDISTNEKIYFDYYIMGNDVSFAENKEQLILHLGKKIYIYNITTNNKTLLCELYFEDFDYLKYINDNYISFIKDKKLILYNVKSKKSEILVSDIEGNNYSYSSGTLKFYYSDKYDKIYELDLKNKNIKYIASGCTPKVSKNGNIITYQKKEGNIIYIIIKDIESGEEWKINNISSKYLLSPDGAYLLMVKDIDANIFNIMNAYFCTIIDSIFGVKWGYIGKELVIYDYKNNIEETIVEKYSRLNFTCLDWI